MHIAQKMIGGANKYFEYSNIFYIFEMFNSDLKMLKNIKRYDINKCAIIIGIVVIFIIIILSICNVNKITLSDNISILSVLSFLFMIIIFVIQTKISNSQTVILNSINEQVSFVPIIFPNSIEKVIFLIQRYKNEKQKQYYLHIYTDVPGYAIFSNNTLWNEFYQALNDAKKDFCIKWHFYSDKKLDEHIDKQFNSWRSFDKKRIKRKIDESIRNIYSRHSPCTYKLINTCRSSKSTDCDCKIIRTIRAEYNSTEPVEKDVDSIKKRVKELHQFAIEQIQELSKDGNVEIKQISNDLPFFAWIFMEGNSNNLDPVAGIVSYSFYNTNGEEREKGFMTKDKALLKILYEIINQAAN